MWVGLLGICAGTVLALHLMFRAAEAPLWGAFALLVVTAFLIFALIWLDRNHGEGGTGYYADGWEDHPGIHALTFDETPNVYFVVFDSIVPEAIVQNQMGIETTDFHRVLEVNMRRFPNLFANSITTIYSLNALLALDWDIFMKQWEDTGSRPSYVAGHDLSPLVWTFRENGYQATSIINTPHFGHRQGMGIDNYIINRKGTVCSLLDRSIRPWVFWGYCWNHSEEADLTKGDFLVRELAGIDSSNPQFVIAHLYLPGHSPKIFDYDNSDDREQYLERFERNFNGAAIYLGQIVEHIKANDSDAILFVYGDHGAWLSRGREIEADPTFFLQDRFGILGGVYPPDRCAAEFDEAESKGYVTSLDVVHAILECLSRGQSPLREPRNDRFWGTGVPEDHSYEYEEFLYE